MSDKLTKDQLNAIDVADLLTLDIDSIEEVTGFKRLPTGTYRLNIEACGLENVGKDERPVIQCKIQVTDVVELEDASEEADLRANTEFPLEYTENFFLDAKDRFGLKAFRTVFGAFAVERQIKLVNEIMAALPGNTGVALINFSSRKDKETGEIRENNNIDMEVGFIAD